jgi:integrase
MSTVNEKKGLSANTVKKIHCLVRGSLEYAKKNQLILMNPADSIELPKTKKYEPRIYNEEQFIKLLEYVEGTPDEIPILLAGAVGLRRGEIFGLRWQDVDFNKCRLSIVETIVRIKGYTIKPPKTNESARIVSIPSYVMDILRNYKESLKILHIDDGERVVTAFKAGTYSEHFGNLFKKCGLPKIRLHDLRHYNAVIMMKYGIPDKVAASRLGHSNTQTLRKVYQHVLTDMDEVAADKINDMFAKNV